MARALVDSWDAIELWLTQLPFPLQVMLAVLVLLPACWGGAAGLDRLWDLTVAWLETRRDPDEDAQAGGSGAQA